MSAVAVTSIGTVRTILDVNQVDITDFRREPTRPPEGAIADHLWSQRQMVEGTLAGWDDERRRFPSLIGHPSEARLELVGNWPEARMDLTFRHPKAPGARLLLSWPLFDEFGQICSGFDPTELDEDLAGAMRALREIPDDAG